MPDYLARKTTGAPFELGQKERSSPNEMAVSDKYVQAGLRLGTEVALVRLIAAQQIERRKSEP